MFHEESESEIQNIQILQENQKNDFNNLFFMFKPDQGVYGEIASDSDETLGKFLLQASRSFFLGSSGTLDTTRNHQQPTFYFLDKK